MEHNLQLMRLDKRRDKINDRIFEKIREKRLVYEKEYHKKKFPEWLSTNYNDKYGTCDFHYNLINQFIDSTTQLLKDKNFKIDKNLYKDNLSSYVYYNNL
jgi:hypothetical protein